MFLNSPVLKGQSANNFIYKSLNHKIENIRCDKESIQIIFSLFKTEKDVKINFNKRIYEKLIYLNTKVLHILGFNKYTKYCKNYAKNFGKLLSNLNFEKFNLNML